MNLYYSTATFRAQLDDPIVVGPTSPISSPNMSILSLLWKSRPVRRSRNFRPCGDGISLLDVFLGLNESIFIPRYQYILSSSFYYEIKIGDKYGYQNAGIWGFTEISCILTLATTSHLRRHTNSGSVNIALDDNTEPRVSEVCKSENFGVVRFRILKNCLPPTLEIVV